jgi:hypothetical protein
MTYAPILLGIFGMVGPVDHQGVFYSTAAKMRANRLTGGWEDWRCGLETAVAALA